MKVQEVYNILKLHPYFSKLSYSKQLNVLNAALINLGGEVVMFELEDSNTSGFNVVAFHPFYYSNGSIIGRNIEFPYSLSDANKQFILNLSLVKLKKLENTKYDTSTVYGTIFEYKKEQIFSLNTAWTKINPIINSSEFTLNLTTNWKKNLSLVREFLLRTGDNTSTTASIYSSVNYIIKEYGKVREFVLNCATNYLVQNQFIKANECVLGLQVDYHIIHVDPDQNISHEQTLNLSIAWVVSGYA